MRGPNLRMGLPESGCKDCAERKPGCAGHCETYAEYRKRVNAVKQRRAEVVLSDREFMSYQEDLKKRINRGRHAKERAKLGIK